MKRDNIVIECADCKVQAEIKSTWIDEKEGVKKWDEELGPDCPVCGSSNTFKDFEESTL